MHDAADDIFADLLSKEYRHNGRGPDQFDCYGLAIEAYRRLGRELPEITAEDDVRLIHERIGAWAPRFVKREAPAPYCLVTFMIHPPYTSHVGVVLSDCCRFIHIIKSSRVTIERLNCILWERRITGYYQWKS